jgi:hypothetical protein
MRPSPTDQLESAWDTVLGFPDSVGVLTRIPRHNSCRHALLFKPGIKSPVVIRMFDRQRRYVPRRLSYPVPADMRTPSPRVRRPALFPGSAYDVSQTATGMRGRVTWNKADANEVPARWVRVEAGVDGHVAGRARRWSTPRRLCGAPIWTAGFKLV